MKRLFCLAIKMFILKVSLGFNPGGWVITQNISEFQHDVKVQTLYIQDNVIRVIDATHIFMVDLNEELITLMLPDEKIYWSGTAAELTKGMNRQITVQIEQALKQIPEAQRDLYRTYFEELMRPVGDDPLKEHRYMLYHIVVTRRPGIQWVAGYETEQYEVLVDGRLVEEISIAPALKPEGRIDFKKFFRIFSPFSGQVTARGYEFSPEYIELLNFGYPLKTVRHDKWGRQTVEVKRLEEKKLSDLDFMIPEHYELIPLDTLLQRQFQNALNQNEIIQHDLNQLDIQN